MGTAKQLYLALLTIAGGVTLALIIRDAVPSYLYWLGGVVFLALWLVTVFWVIGPEEQNTNGDQREKFGPS